MVGETTSNQLYYGDNLTVLRKSVPDESVDLIYLDPPFNSQRAYNAIFQDYERTYHKVIVEVKGGGYQPKDVRSLKAVMDREQSPLGVLVALEPPTKGMLADAASLGVWKLPGGQASYPVLQLFTIGEYFKGRLPHLPDTSGTLKSAPRILGGRERTAQLEGI